MATKRGRKSLAPCVSNESAEDGRKGSKAAAMEEVLGALAPLLQAAEFTEQAHVPALYRLGALPGKARRAVPAVREPGKGGGDPVAEALGLPSPFLAVDLGDQRGIWQSEPAILKRLGEDPSKQLRQSHAVPQPGGGAMRAVAPAGLKNLGATCYLNSLLQYLFFNANFRSHLLQADSRSEVVQALQRVFALMAAGDCDIVDPSDFVRLVGVTVDEQEDATEFSTLLLDWLERELGQGPEVDGEKAKGGGAFIPTLFQGEVSRVLTCFEDPSHVSERREPFFELRARLGAASGSAKGKAVGADRRAAATATMVQPPEATVVVAGGAADPAAVAAAATPCGSKRATSGGKKKPLPVLHLEDLLASTAFPDEMLDGANQYHCEKCNKKVDARASIRLAKPPPFLHITLERHHYDLQKGERRKLNNPVSFPQSLRLRLAGGSPAPAEAATAASYACVGFLEHLSDSAHSGHYTATLYQEDPDAAQALALAARPVEGGDGSCSASQEAEGEERPAKRQCLQGAARRGLWWTLDDDTVTPKSWLPASAEGSAPALCAPPRIESASAYLVLYRRCDVERPAAGLPAPLDGFVAAANASSADDRETHAERVSAVTGFVSERRKAVSALVQALRKISEDGLHAAELAPEALSVVPTAWLDHLLQGTDRSEKEVDEIMRIAPMLYGRTLMRAPGGDAQDLVLDPLAVWCGQVKLVPTAALDDLKGLCGLDSSLFLSADSVVGRSACEAAWHLLQIFMQEWLQIGKVLYEGKVSAAEAREWQSEGRGEDAVWVSLRMQRVWHKVLNPGPAAKCKEPQVAILRAFLREAQAARWPQLGGEAEDAGTEAEAPASRPGEVSLSAGLLCDHGLVGCPKAGFLAKRTDLARLLELTGAKEKAYRQLWPDAPAVPRLRTGVPGGALLSFSEVCEECRDRVSCVPATNAAAPSAAREAVAFQGSIFRSACAASSAGPSAAAP